MKDMGVENRGMTRRGFLKFGKSLRQAGIALMNLPRAYLERPNSSR